MYGKLQLIEVGWGLPGPCRPLGNVCPQPVSEAPERDDLHAEASLWFWQGLIRGLHTALPCFVWGVDGIFTRCITMEGVGCWEACTAGLLGMSAGCCANKARGRWDLHAWTAMHMAGSMQALLAIRLHFGCSADDGTSPRAGRYNLLRVQEACTAVPNNSSFDMMWYELSAPRMEIPGWLFKFGVSLLLMGKERRNICSINIYIPAGHLDTRVVRSYNLPCVSRCSMFQQLWLQSIVKHNCDCDVYTVSKCVCNQYANETEANLYRSVGISAPCICQQNSTIYLC